MKRLVADLTLDKHILNEVIRRKDLKPSRCRELVNWIQNPLPGEYDASVPTCAKQVIEAWRRDYNERLPDISLGYLTPNEFAQLGQKNRVEAVRH